jgi:hypothetical protein
VKSRIVKKLPSSGCLSRLLRARHTGSKAHGCSATFPGAVPRQDAVHRAEDAADYEQARVRLESGLSKLRLLAATVDGIVGNPNPFKAISEVFERRKVDEVVVFTLPKGISRWLHKTYLTEWSEDSTYPLR